LGPDSTVTGNYNLNVIQNKRVYENEIPDKLIKGIMGFYIRIRTSSYSPIKKGRPVMPFSPVPGYIAGGLPI
jgi:hypothetical protein